MKKIRIFLVIAAFLALILSGLLTRQNEAIWILTRATGIVSLFVLFISIATGELKVMLPKDAKLAKIHIVSSVLSIALVFLHMAYSILDNFKWGADLDFWQYLGLSFSNKWLVLISIGSLSFYAMAVVGISSSRKSMKMLKFKRWKIVHYISYAAFFMAYVHSVNLGTDFNHSALAGFMMVSANIMFIFVIAALMIRLLHKRLDVKDRWAAMSAITIVFILIFGTVAIAENVVSYNEKVAAEENKEAIAQEAVDAKAKILNDLYGQVESLKTGDVEDG